jgi:plastocyanin
VWKNPTGVKHSVTATSGNWSKDVVIKPGTKTAKVFKKRGAYDYKCRFHKDMTGHVHVD